MSQIVRLKRVKDIRLCFFYFVVVFDRSKHKTSLNAIRKTSSCRQITTTTCNIANLLAEFKKNSLPAAAANIASCRQTHTT